MAGVLSGTTSKAYFGNSHYWLYLTWSATQSISGNYSTVTANLYFGSDSGWDISASAKNASIVIDGSTYSFTASPSEGGGTTIKLGTYTHQVNHNSDGTKTFTVSGTYDLSSLTITSNLGSRTTSGTYTLTTIPRKSSLTSSCNFTAGNNVSCTISKDSSSFTSNLTLWVQNADSSWNTIATATGITGTTYTFDLTSSPPNAKTTSIFNSLAGASSRQSSIRVETFDGGTSLGYTDYYGTCSAPSASTGTISNPTGISATSGQENSTVYIDQTITVSVDRSNSNFTHTLNFKDGNSGAVVHTATGVTTSYSWTPSSSEMTTLYNDTPNSIEFDGQVDILTYYGGTQVQATYGMDINYRVRSTNVPTFGTGYTYTDINSTTSAITGDPTYIIQNHSDLQVTIPTTAFATAVNGATMASYSVTVNGVTKTAVQGSSNIVLDFGAVNAGTNQTLTVTAIDSRGLSTTTSTTVKILPYVAPVVTASAKRLNGFEAEIDITLSGAISSLTTTAQKNQLTAISGESSPLEYCYAENTTGSTYSAWIPFTYTTNGATYTATAVSISLDNTKSYNFQIRATDKLMTSTQPITVASGQPVLFVDFDLNSVGVGKFPTGTDTFETVGEIHTQGNLHVVSPAGSDSAWVGFYGADGTTRKGWIGDGYNTDDDIAIEAETGNIQIKPASGKQIIANAPIVLPSNQYATSTGGAGIQLNNSDIVGFNQFFSNDSASTDSEAMNWAKDTTPAGSTNHADYDSLRVYASQVLLNSVVIGTDYMQGTLWTGAYYLLDTQTVTPTKKLSQCVNGWILGWSDYTSSVANNYDWNYTVIPKWHADNTAPSGYGGNGVGMWAWVATDFNKYTQKYFYVSDDHITGHANNSNTTNQPNSTSAVLRVVIAF